MFVEGHPFLNLDGRLSSRCVLGIVRLLAEGLTLYAHFGVALETKGGGDQSGKLE